VSTPAPEPGRANGDQARRTTNGDPQARRTEEPSLGELLTDLGDEVSTLFRQEVALAKVEITRDVTQIGRASGMLAAGAFLGVVTVLLVAWTIAWGLAELVPVWVGFLITAVLFGAVAAGLIMVGRKRIREVDPKPATTIETLQEDKQWISDRMSS
jgi:hypothetical protein